jgi:hypothetical protein
VNGTEPVEQKGALDWMKSGITNLAKLVGAILLLPILAGGISSLLTHCFGNRGWIIETNDGEFTDARFLLSGVGGFVLWFYLLYKIKSANMSDEEKRSADRRARNYDDGW